MCTFGSTRGRPAGAAYAGGPHETNLWWRERGRMKEHKGAGTLLKWDSARAADAKVAGR